MVSEVVTDRVRMVASCLRVADKSKAESLVDVPELNHIERKIIRWGFMDGMSIRQVAERLCLSETRVKHLKRGAMDKIADFMEREVGDAAYKSAEKEVQL